jgi:hypothetical protein
MVEIPVVPCRGSPSVVGREGHPHPGAVVVEGLRPLTQHQHGRFWLSRLSGGGSDASPSGTDGGAKKEKSQQDERAAHPAIVPVESAQTKLATSGEERRS